MGIITTADIRAGMVLAADVKDRSGRVLLSADTEIAEKQIKILKMWGITEADVKGVAPAGGGASSPPGVDAEAFARAEAETSMLFAHTNAEHPAVKELFRLAVARTLASKKESTHGS